jgi:hypothetical protein
MPLRFETVPSIDRCQPTPPRPMYSGCGRSRMRLITGILALAASATMVVAAARCRPDSAPPSSSSGESPPGVVTTTTIPTQPGAGDAGAGDAGAGAGREHHDAGGAGEVIEPEGGHVDPGERESEVEHEGEAAVIGYVPDRRPGIMLPCGGSPRTAENPLGLRGGQHVSPQQARAFYRAGYARAERNGVSRVVWHMPAGWGGAVMVEETMRGASQSLAAMGDRAVVWLEETRAFLKRRPGASVGVYVSAQVPRDTFVAGNPGDDFEPYRHDDQSHRRRMITEIIQPYLDGGVTEIWFDHGSPREYRPEIVRLCRFLREQYGVHVVMEALPLNLDRSPNLATMKDVPSGALHRFFVAFDRRNEWKWPEDVEVHVLLSKHEAVVPTRTLATEADVRSYIDRGFVVWSMHEDFDPLLRLALEAHEAAQAGGAHGEGGAGDGR